MPDKNSKEPKIKIFRNCRIFTPHRSGSDPDTLIVAGNNIAKVCHSQNLDYDFWRQKYPVREIDLEDRRVLPGFVDSHMHALFMARDRDKIACLPPEVESIADIKEKIKEKKRELEEGEWIRGWGYDEEKLDEKRSPLREDLDRAAPDHPVMLIRTCNHIAVLNSEAMRQLGINSETSEPEGGEIEKDSEENLTGIFKEKAMMMILNDLPDGGIDQRAESLLACSQDLFSLGITTIADSMAEKTPIDYYEIYRRAMKKGLKHKVILHYKWSELRNKEKMPDFKLERSSQIHIGGVKVIADGSVSGLTAWVDPAYSGADQNFGSKLIDREELRRAAEYARRNSLQLIIHAMGNKAIEMSVDTLYQHEGWLKNRPSIRLEHAALPDKKSLDKAARGDIGIVSQPIFPYAEIGRYLKNLGPERTSASYPFKSILDREIPLAFSSDSPATSWNPPADPLAGIKSAVTRKAHEGTVYNAEEGLSIAKSLRLYTESAAKISGLKDVGRLAEGFQADFIVLNRDILEAAPKNIDRIEIEKTYKKGILMHG